MDIATLPKQTKKEPCDCAGKFSRCSQVTKVLAKVFYRWQWDKLPPCLVDTDKTTRYYVAYVVAVAAKWKQV